MEADKSAVTVENAASKMTLAAATSNQSPPGDSAPATTDAAENGAPKISKGQAKKDAKKEAKAKAKAEASNGRRANPRSSNKEQLVAAQTMHTEKFTLDDPESMFKAGFLADVYKERPIGSKGTENVVTRFPPEPNGYLHIGHSKAIAINFGFAKYHGGECYLRFDDTNPAGEKKEYDESIEETVRWLGYTPKMVTHSSDNFQRLYDLAEKLVMKRKAYVCHCTKAEIMDQRGGGEGKKPRYACPHRDRPPAESLTEFRAMRDGKYKPNEAALRMKQNLEDGNPQMWDLFAYRIPQPKPEAAEHPDKAHDNADDDEDEELDAQFTGQHYRTGDKWRIYPTYDFTHCLCDSFEGITHSLCTTEFELSRVSYEWLNKELEVYEPMQREYGRLSVAGTVLSKRRIQKLVNEGYVRSWDDPRLYTLPALRRRGIPPGAILAFINELGVTKANTVIEIKRFETSVRRYLEVTVPRLMLVLEPLKVIIDDLPDDHEEMLEAPFSKDPSFGVHDIPFTKTVFIERGDFREVDAPDFFRLAPGKTVGLLKVPYPITATRFEKDQENGQVTAVHARYEKPREGEKPIKPKGWIHWVAESPRHASPVHVRVRALNPLFKSANPSTNPGGFLADVNPNSEEIFPDALIETGFAKVSSGAPWPAEAGEKAASEDPSRSHAENDEANPTHLPPVKKVGPESIRFQGMRIGYYCVDKDTKHDDIILNRIVTLKEDSGKKGA